MKLIMQHGYLVFQKYYRITKKLSNLKIDVEDIANIIMDYPDKTIQISLDFLQMVAKMEIKLFLIMQQYMQI